jgi:hypothetical protein
LNQPEATPPSTTADQDARLAYEAYRDTLEMSFPVPWEHLTVRVQAAWRAVVDVVRAQAKEETP